MKNTICRVKLSERYLTYLKLCVKIETARSYVCNGQTIYPDLSVQDGHFGPRANETFTVIQIGDGCRNDKWYVETEDGKSVWVDSKNVVIVEGSTRGVPKRGKIVMGKSSLMGGIAHGIKSGKAFQGR